MNIPKPIVRVFQPKASVKDYNNVLEQNELLSRQVRSLLAEVQGSTDITTNTDSTSSRHYVGTPDKYNTYSKQVAELDKLYNNTADWGCMVAKNIIDVRTAFSVGKGVKAIKRAGFEGSAEKELAWVKEFMRYNNLDEEMPQEYAKEAELEGKCLLRFLYVQSTNQVRVVHTPWRKHTYTVETPEFDYFDYTRAWYTGSGQDRVSFDLKSPFFVYRRFGGNASNVNETPPKIAFVLREIEDMDKAIWDWRKINRIFTAPTPVITCSDAQTAKKINDQLDGSNWRIGKLLVLGGENVDFKLVGWEGDGYTTIKSEIEMLAQTISGTTGVPVHFLGYPNLLSNRDTATALVELIGLSTSKERHTWVGVYEELFQKAMMLYNTVNNTRLNPLAVGAAIEEFVPNEEGDGNAPVPNRDNSGTQPAGNQ